MIKIICAAVAVVMLSGCLPPSEAKLNQLRLEREQFEIERKERAKQHSHELYLARLKDMGITEAEVESRAKDRQAITQWGITAPETRISATGPILSAYQKDYQWVGMCKIDVRRVVQDTATKERFIKQCYDLLPVANRDRMYRMDQLNVDPYESEINIIILQQPNQRNP